MRNFSSFRIWWAELTAPRFFKYQRAAMMRAGFSETFTKEGERWSRHFGNREQLEQFAPQLRELVALMKGRTSVRIITDRQFGGGLPMTAKQCELLYNILNTNEL